MKISTYKRTNEILDKYNFKIKKSLGQNFLIDQNILKKIVDLSNIGKDTLVIEIGPGIGALSEFILDKCGYLVMYEIDKRLIPILNDTLKDYKNFKLINEDFLESDVQSDIKDLNFKEIVLISNLPYYVTIPIITKIIEDDLPIQKLILMMQKEVAERLSAKPNTKKYNSLSIFIQYNYDVKTLMNVSRNVFYPKPNVDSSVLKLEKRKKYFVNDEKLFFRFVKEAFSQRRKMLKNNLRNFDLKKLEKIFTELNLSLMQRAEELKIEDYINIVNRLSKE